MFPLGQEHWPSIDLARNGVQIWRQISKGAASQPWSTVRLENADHCKIARKKHWKICNSLLQCNNAKKTNLGVFCLQNLGKIFKQLSLDEKAILDKAHGLEVVLQTKNFQTELTLIMIRGPINHQSSTRILILKAVKKKPANPEIGRKNPKM